MSADRTLGDSLDEVIRRREKMERVTSRISSDFAQGRLRTLFLRRQFLARRQASRNEERGIPAIVVEEARGMGGAGLRIDTSGANSRTPPPLSPSLSPRSPYSPGNGGSSSEGRNSFEGEDGEQVVNQMLDRWGGGFAALDD